MTPPGGGLPGVGGVPAEKFFALQSSAGNPVAGPLTCVDALPAQPTQPSGIDVCRSFPGESVWFFGRSGT
ncbi:hypothetical protein F4558_000455 [Micromonospora profundi]|nr:hypothetical protein [Micromonospora profundi]